jgi:hypothetical protein
VERLSEMDIFPGRYKGNGVGYNVGLCDSDRAFIDIDNTDFLAILRLTRNQR